MGCLRNEKASEQAWKAGEDQWDQKKVGEIEHYSLRTKVSFKISN